MSSDCYVDFEPLTGGVDSWSKQQLDAYDPNWIGHISRLQARFRHGLDLHSVLQTLVVASGGVVQPWVGDAAEKLLENWWSRLHDDVRLMGAEDFDHRYGQPPVLELWKDSAPEPGQLKDLFAQNVGKRWCVRVD